MSRYTVDWAVDAEEALTNIWLQSNDRQAVTDASARIDRLLEMAPLANGDEVAEGLRKLVVSPLAVFYSVDRAGSLVEVSQVAWIRT